MRLDLIMEVRGVGGQERALRIIKFRLFYNGLRGGIRRYFRSENDVTVAFTKENVISNGEEE